MPAVSNESQKRSLMSYSAFEAEVAKVNDVLCAVNLLIWDSRTMMPQAAAEARGKQLGTLVELARDMATGNAMLGGQGPNLSRTRRADRYDGRPTGLPLDGWHERYFPQLRHIQHTRH